MTTRLLFKVTGPNAEPYHGGSSRWPLPTRNANGTWTPGEPITAAGELISCQNGLHICEPAHLIPWLGPVIHLVQVPEGVEELRGRDKLVVRTARLERTLTTWNARTARHFACDCAERVLRCTADPRPAEAIRVARLFADGLATDRERAAAATAAWEAAREAWAAAWEAAREAGAAAWEAAREAAAAAGAAAREAERTWQTARLMQYLRGEAP